MLWPSQKRRNCGFSRRSGGTTMAAHSNLAPDAGPGRSDRRHRRLGRHLRAGEGRAGALSALRLPRRPLRDRIARTRPACGRANALTGPPGLGRGRLARPPAGRRVRASDSRARPDDRLERRLHHRPLRRLHAAPRAAALPHTGRRGSLGWRRARGRRSRDALRRRVRATRWATCSCSPDRRRTRFRSC